MFSVHPVPALAGTAGLIVAGHLQRGSLHDALRAAAAPDPGTRALHPVGRCVPSRGVASVTGAVSPSSSARADGTHPTRQVLLHDPPGLGVLAGDARCGVPSPASPGLPFRSSARPGTPATWSSPNSATPRASPAWRQPAPGTSPCAWRWTPPTRRANSAVSNRSVWVSEGVPPCVGLPQAHGIDRKSSRTQPIRDQSVGRFNDHPPIGTHPLGPRHRATF